MANVVQDLGFTCRLLRKSPGFTITCILTLGVGIGINVAIACYRRAGPAGPFRWWRCPRNSGHTIDTPRETAFES
jgi:hypothetical protein